MVQRRQDLKQASKWGRGWEALPVRESQGAELEGSISGRELTWRHSQRRLAAASSSTLPAQSAVDNNNNGKLQPPIKIQVVDSGANWMRTSQLETRLLIVSQLISVSLISGSGCLMFEPYKSTRLVPISLYNSSSPSSTEMCSCNGVLLCTTLYTGQTG